MDNSLIDYEKNLEELEIQKEKLQKLMQKMGQEWEESGPGIGWLEQVDLPAINTKDTESIPLTISNEPLFTNMLSLQSGPSPKYLQSLLNVNEVLLAESLTADNTAPIDDMIEPSSILTPLDESINTPLITPDEAMILKAQKDFYTTDHILPP